MNEVTYQQIDDITQRIAYKLGRDYGLKDSDFVIKFWPKRNFDYVIKTGGIIRVYFTHTPKFVDYEAMMRRCLKQVALIKNSKRTGIIVYGSDKKMTDELHQEFPEWEQLPTLLPYDQMTFETLYKVTMTHRKTGLTVIKEGKIGKYHSSIPRLMIDARLELSDLVAALEKAREETEANKLPKEINEMMLKAANFGDSESER